MGLGDRLVTWALRKLGGLLLLCGILVAIIYGLYEFFSASMDCIHPAIRVAIAIGGIGLVLLIASLIYERWKSSEEEEELKEILHERDNIIKDRFDHLIESCAVLDIEEEMTRDEFFSMVSGILSPQIGVDKKEINRLLEKREQESTTVLEQGLAIPHIVVEGEGKFEIVLARSKKGIIFSPDKDPVHIIFVLAGSMDERNFHLRALMAIANIVREHNFYPNFMDAINEERLRMIILSSTRKRQI